MDEALLKVGSELIWRWIVAIEPKNRQILSLSLSKGRNVFVAERFIHGLVKVYGKHPVSTDMVVGLYPMAGPSLKRDYNIHSSLEKTVIDRNAIVYQKQNRKF